jgi:hypothetical protein
MPRCEFYRDASGCFVDQIYDLEHPDIIAFVDFDDQTIYELFDHCLKFPQARSAFAHLNNFFPGDKRKILRQFILCNWADLDDKIDITDAALNFENVSCKHKDNDSCPFKGKGIVCINI